MKTTLRNSIAAVVLLFAAGNISAQPFPLINNTPYVVTVCIEMGGRQDCAPFNTPCSSGCFTIQPGQTHYLTVCNPPLYTLCIVVFDVNGCQPQFGNNTHTTSSPVGCCTISGPWVIPFTTTCSQNFTIKRTSSAWTIN